MIKLFTLGELYISDFVSDGAEPRGGKHELQLVMEEDTGAVKIKTPPPVNMMFGKYYYRSGINENMRKELENIVNSVLSLIKLNKNDIWLDIASNDGTLLSFVPKNLTRVGIDPAEDSFKLEAEKSADFIIQDYFSASAFKKIYGRQKCKIITCIAMFYDISKPDNFLNDVYEILDNEGLFVLQMNHSGLMIDQCAFDNIVHEHVYYYTLNSINIYLRRNGFIIVDCQLNETNGGSFRIYVRKTEANPKLFATQPYRDVCRYRIDSLLLYEKHRYLDSYSTWIEFFGAISQTKKHVAQFFNKVKSEKKTVWAYGASTKGNTFLQYMGLDCTKIIAIADRNPVKWGLRTVGTNIPIVSEDEMRKAKPDYVVILPWHFISNFKVREKAYLDAGGKFVVFYPKLEIIEK